MSSKLTVVLAKDRSAKTDHQLLEEKLLAGLRQRHHLKVTVTPHLYDLAPDGAGMTFLRSVEGDLIVLGWLYPRAVYWVLNANDVRGRLGPTSSLPEEDLAEPEAAAGDAGRTLWCLDLRSHPRVEPYLEEIDGISASVLGPDAANRAAANGHVTEVEEEAAQRWYPVIDFERCTNCLECLNFCLFGVYSLDQNDNLLVEDPDACRAGCPACARICPEGAIMFPQHKDPGIAGDPEAAASGLKLDLSQLFGGRSPAEMAAAERERALSQTAVEDGKPPQRDELDDLVDKLDDMEL